MADLHLQRFWTAIRKGVFDGGVCVPGTLLDMDEDGEGRRETNNEWYGMSIETGKTGC